MMSKQQELVTALEKARRAIKEYRKLLYHLWEENEVLRRALKIAIEQLGAKIPEEYMPMVYEEHYIDEDELRGMKLAKAKEQSRQILRVAVKLILEKKAPVGYREVVEACRNEPGLKYLSPETITRALRKLAELGFLSRPAPGRYFLGKKLIEKHREIKREKERGEKEKKQRIVTIDLFYGLRS